MDFEIKPDTVYVKPDERERITAVNSSAFLRDVTSWTEIDSGYGDKYHHAQGNYFPKPIMDERGIYRYKLAETSSVNGEAIATFPIGEGLYGVYERTASEMDADYVEPEDTPSQLDRIEAQALYTALMTDTLIEEV